MDKKKRPHTYWENDTHISRATQVAQQYRIHQILQKTQVQSLGWEDPMEKEMTTHSSILAWEILWREELGGL